LLTVIPTSLLTNLSGIGDARHIGTGGYGEDGAERVEGRTGRLSAEATFIVIMGKAFSGCLGDRPLVVSGRSPVNDERPHRPQRLLCRADFAIEADALPLS
ncbi:hypothetical protein, partial [Cupriavidus sp. CuC1]|uniref:hypothetical protein n=1 Tax=Cupriavidus sp. CuC1 TaxID=3373131 RepID=UPI0037D255FA